MKSGSNQRKPVALDPETRAALEEGLRMADQDPQRWTPEEGTADAQRMTKEWRKKIGKKASA